MVEGIGKSNGKVILLGEHAVVYGEPAIAFPLNQLQVTATVNTVEGVDQLVDSILYKGIWQEMPNRLRGLRILLENLILYFGWQQQAFHLKIVSQLPAARGMGSSAAIAVAVVRSFFAAVQKPCEPAILQKFVDISEEIYHGNPSGIDLYTTSSSHPVYFQKKHVPQYFENKLAGYLVIADTGQVGQTFKAVADVKRFIEKNPLVGRQSINAIGNCVEEGKIALEENKLQKFGQLMDENQQLLAVLGASNEKIQQLASAAKKAGALGAKLTGSGQGGCVLALAMDLSHAEQLEKVLLSAGGVKVWLQPLSI